MNEGITVQQLEAEKRRLEAEIKALSDLIAVKSGGNAKSGVKHFSPQVSESTSIRGRVIDAVVELVEKNGRQVTNKEIMTYVIEVKQLSLGNMKNKVTGLGAILSQESQKKNGRIKQVSRGVWDKK